MAERDAAGGRTPGPGNRSGGGNTSAAAASRIRVDISDVTKLKTSLSQTQTEAKKLSDTLSKFDDHALKSVRAAREEIEKLQRALGSSGARSATGPKPTAVGSSSGHGGSNMHAGSFSGAAAIGVGSGGSSYLPAANAFGPGTTVGGTPRVNLLPQGGAGPTLMQRGGSYLTTPSGVAPSASPMQQARGTPLYSMAAMGLGAITSVAGLAAGHLAPATSRSYLANQLTLASGGSMSIGNQMNVNAGLTQRFAGTGVNYADYTQGAAGLAATGATAGAAGQARFGSAALLSAINPTQGLGASAGQVAGLFTSQNYYSQRIAGIQMNPNNQNVGKLFDQIISRYESQVGRPLSPQEIQSAQQQGSPLNVTVTAMGISADLLPQLVRYWMSKNRTGKTGMAAAQAASGGTLFHAMQQRGSAVARAQGNLDKGFMPGATGAANVQTGVVNALGDLAGTPFGKAMGEAAGGLAVFSSQLKLASNALKTIVAWTIAQRVLGGGGGVGGILGRGGGGGLGGAGGGLGGRMLGRAAVGAGLWIGGDMAAGALASHGHESMSRQVGAASKGAAIGAQFGPQGAVIGASVGEVGGAVSAFRSWRSADAEADRAKGREGLSDRKLRLVKAAAAKGIHSQTNAQYAALLQGIEAARSHDDAGAESRALNALEKFVNQTGGSNDNASIWGGSGQTYKTLERMAAKGPHEIVTSTTGGQHAQNSYHYKGQALDLADKPGSVDSPGLLAINKYLAKNYGHKLAELIYAGPGAVNIKNGKVVNGMATYGSATMAGHHNHVHVAATPASLGMSGGVDVGGGEGPQSASSSGGFNTGGTASGLSALFSTSSGAALIAALQGSGGGVASASPGGGGGSALSSPTALGIGNAPSNPKGNVALGKRMAAARGWAGKEWDALYWLWNHESGWRTDAKNPSSGAFGIPQSLPASKMRSAGADYMTNPATQIKWGLDYIGGRYTDPLGAVQHEKKFNWYERGAYDVIRDEVGKLHQGEMVLPAGTAAKVRQVVENPHAGQSSGGRRGGSTVPVQLVFLVTQGGESEARAHAARFARYVAEDHDIDMVAMR